MKGVELVCVGALGVSGKNFIFSGGAESISIREESDEQLVEEGLTTISVFFITRNYKVKKHIEIKYETQAKRKEKINKIET